ncbi:MAG: hypothetical protein LBJ16_01275 [Holosporaceae bacterium]|nr:hypothetical protein [Holosporaceae bacterium]
MLALDNLLDILSLSLAFSLIGLNVFLSSSVMKITDMSCDASVSLGGCSYGVLVLMGYDPYLSGAVAIFLGALVGLVTSSMINSVRLEPVVAGIITVTLVSSILVKTCSGLNNVDAQQCSALIKDNFSAVQTFFVTLVSVAVTAYLFCKILHSEYGLGMRVFGDGEIVSESLGIDVNLARRMALSLGNSLSAIAGVLIAKITGVFSVTMGSGSMIFGVTTLIVAEKFLPPKTFRGALGGCILGAICYKFLIASVVYVMVGTKLGGSTYDGLITALVLGVLMLLTNLKNFPLLAKRRTHG